LNLIRYEDGFSGSIGTDHSQCFEWISLREVINRGWSS
jgi:hypothetical protein